MGMFDQIIEQRIEAAIAAGELDDLPGAGKPLTLDDDALVAEELRAAYRVLKNAGLVPPEIEMRREIAGIASLVRHAINDEVRGKALARLALLEAKLELEGRALPRGAYRDRIVERL